MGRELETRELRFLTPRKQTKGVKRGKSAEGVGCSAGCRAGVSNQSVLII